MEKVLVTGANGFIGSHLAVELAEKGFFVYGLHRRKEAKNHNAITELIPEKTGIIQGKEEK